MQFSFTNFRNVGCGYSNLHAHRMIIRNSKESSHKKYTRERLSCQHALYSKHNEVEFNCLSSLVSFNGTLNYSQGNV